MIEKTAENAVKKAEKQPTGRKLFLMRMQREGRMKEWRQMLKTVKAEYDAEGKYSGWGAICYPAMRRMGWESAARERELLAEHERNEGLTKVQVQVKKEREEIREERKIETFDEAVRTLPDSAPSRVEIDWIRCHPAMARKARMKNSMDPVLITAEDVLQPPHGKAPSKAAVYALQHWANYPIEFFKSILGEQKKQTDEAAKADRLDESLDEVYRLLSQVEHARKPDGRVPDGADGPIEVDTGVATGDFGTTAVLSLGPEGMRLESV